MKGTQSRICTVTDLTRRVSAVGRLAERLSLPDDEPVATEAERAEAAHALAQAPSCPQSNLFGEEQ